MIKPLQIDLGGWALSRFFAISACLHLILILLLNGQVEKVTRRVCCWKWLRRQLPLVTGPNQIKEYWPPHVDFGKTLSHSAPASRYIVHLLRGRPPSTCSDSRWSPSRAHQTFGNIYKIGSWHNNNKRKGRKISFRLLLLLRYETVTC